MAGENLTHVFRLLPGTGLRLSIESFVKKIILKPAGLPVAWEALQHIRYVSQTRRKPRRAMVILNIKFCRYSAGEWVTSPYKYF
ncbi:MAG: hypothetical protein M3015_03355 [Bacteroidota bacterium]|nr:hypothetical protein [Bacteroidota bacterium]